jgi:hypothetical protein
MWRIAKESLGTTHTRRKKMNLEMWVNILSTAVFINFETANQNSKTTATCIKINRWRRLQSLINYSHIRYWIWWFDITQFLLVSIVLVASKALWTFLLTRSRKSGYMYIMLKTLSACFHAYLKFN